MPTGGIDILGGLGALFGTGAGAGLAADATAAGIDAAAVAGATDAAATGAGLGAAGLGTTAGGVGSAAGLGAGLGDVAGAVGGDVFGAAAPGVQTAALPGIVSDTVAGPASGVTAAAGNASATLPGGAIGAGTTPGASIIATPLAAPAAGVSPVSAIAPAAADAPVSASLPSWLAHPFTSASELFTDGGAIPPFAPTAQGAAAAAANDMLPASGIGSTVGSFIAKNPLQIAGAGIMGTELLMGNKPLPAQKQLGELAAEQATQGRTLAGYSQTGTLPPGMQQIIDANTASAKAAIRSKYAQMGYSGSSAEVDALRQVDEAAAGQVSQIANQLLQQGRDFSQLSDQEFATLMQTESAQSLGFQQALARFAGGLAGAKTA